jgi:hypothetical protein
MLMKIQDMRRKACTRTTVRPYRKAIREIVELVEEFMPLKTRFNREGEADEA